MNKWLRFFLVFLLMLAIDLYTKHLAMIHLSKFRAKAVIPGFLQLTLVHNTGAAFGIGSKWSMYFFVATSIVATIVVLYLFSHLKPEEKFSRWGLIFILSGAIGNLVDRIRLGYVIDFIDVFVGRHHWSAFNVADAAITVGAVLFGIEILRQKRSAAAAEPVSPGENSAP